MGPYDPPIRPRPSPAQLARIMAAQTGYTQTDVGTMEKAAYHKGTANDSQIDGILTTEREYVQELERISKLRQSLLEGDVLPVSAVEVVFAESGALLDFQRQFLAALESHASSRSWPDVFADYEHGFQVYFDLASNLARATKFARQQFGRGEGRKTVSHQILLRLSDR